MRITRDNVNSAGQLVGFGVHDSVLVGLSVEFGRSLALSLRRANGATARLELGGLGPVGIRGLRNGAIVSDVFLWNPAEVPTGALQLSDGAFAVLFAGDVPQVHLPRAARDITRANQRDWIIQVSCSYGGALAALCNQVDILEGG